MMRVFSVVVAASTFLLAGCPKKDDGGTTTTSPKTQKAERFVELKPEMISRGKAAFGACMGCHGEGAEGRVGIGPRLVSDSFLEASSDRFLFDTIKNGRAGTTMVPWGNSYSSEQIQSLVAYIRSLKPTEPALLDESPLKGVAPDGADEFRGICAGCHGRNGGGYMETSNGTGIGRTVFLDTASDGFMRHIIKSGKSHTAMRGFANKDPMAVANLSEQQIDDVIAYLRANAW